MAHDPLAQFGLGVVAGRIDLGLGFGLGAWHVVLAYIVAPVEAGIVVISMATERRRFKGSAQSAQVSASSSEASRS